MKVAQDDGEIDSGLKNGLNCLNCPKRVDCRDICQEIEDILPKKTTGRHKKEIVVSGNYVESLGVQYAFFMLYGRKYDIFKHETP